MPGVTVNAQQEGVPLRDHYDALLQARERTIEVQIASLTSAVRAAQDAGTREHAEVRADLALLGADVAGARRDHTSLALKVEGITTAAATSTSMRSGDLAKMGFIVVAVNLVIAGVSLFL